MADKVHDTGGGPLQTSMPNKRNLSNSSISPKVADKKPKIFVTPNRFAALYSEDSSDTVFITSTNSASACNEKPGPANQSIEQPTLDVQDVTPRAPPFYISNISNFSAFTNVLTKITGPNAFTCKSTKSYLIVYPRGVYNYNTILTHLKDTDSSFHTFQAHVNRSFRVAIRNLHHSTLCSEISLALSEEGHSVKQVINVKNKNKCGLPLFFVDLNRQNNNNDIFNITSLLNTKVIIEKPHLSRRGPPQCHNCQAYGHTDNYCQHESRCVKCGGDHRSEDCIKDRASPAKCALCSEVHTANYKGCRVYQSVIKKRTKVLTRVLPVSDKPPSIHTRRKGVPRTYAEATVGNSNNLNSEPISNIISQFITQLNSLFTPLISLLSSLLNTLLSKNTLSP